MAFDGFSKFIGGIGKGITDGLEIGKNQREKNDVISLDEARMNRMRGQQGAQGNQSYRSARPRPYVVPQAPTTSKAAQDDPSTFRNADALLYKNTGRHMEKPNEIKGQKLYKTREGAWDYYDENE